jgi:NAD(P) transhydrogenase subunit alpha
MRVAIPKEIHPGERRVAATPQTVLRLKKLGFDVVVQAGAGAETDFSDAAYQEAGAAIVTDIKKLWSEADIILKVRPPQDHPTLAVHEADLLNSGAVLVGLIWPGLNNDLMKRLAARKATVLAMDCVPRITRAQKMDALSAMANIAGYRSVIEAANYFPRFFAGQSTAAGKIEPAKVLVIGAGVAGLAAIGAARALGAVVRAFDTRPATRDQVKSMGAEFLEVHIKEEGETGGGYGKEMSQAFIQAEMALFAAQAMDVDIIITTALIPGKKAPQLITSGMVESMKPGSVIVDLAAEQGGNCALTKPGEVVTHKGVTVVGYTDLPSRMAAQSSQLYGATIVALLDEMMTDGKFGVDVNDVVVRGALAIHNGEITWPPPTPPPPPEPGVTQRALAPANGNGNGHSHGAKKPAKDRTLIYLILCGLLLAGVGLVSPPSFLGHFTVFVLACFVGWQVVWNVKPALHTPLMSVTNAISGIILIGGMLQLQRGKNAAVATVILGAIAVLIATINIAGGFLVTNRMLAMFRKK